MRVVNCNFAELKGEDMKEAGRLPDVLRVAVGVGVHLDWRKMRRSLSVSLSLCLCL